MPFTFSHPAAILPLSRRPLVASALIAGSIAPDLPYFLPAATSSAWGAYSDFNLTLTHAVGTGLAAGPVLALVMLVLYHQLFKRPLVALLPPAAAGRLTDVVPRLRWREARQLGWIVVSAVSGVLTHLAWDSLTHESAFADSVPALRAHLVGSIDVAQALWYLSTAVGALALAGWLRGWWRRTPCRPVAPPTVLGRTARRGTIAALAAAGVTGAVLRTVWVGVDVLDASHPEAALRVMVTGAMSGTGAGLLLYALLWQARSGRVRGPRGDVGHGSAQISADPRASAATNRPAPR